MSREPHEITIEDAEPAYFVCRECGERVNIIDGETAEHDDPALNPWSEVALPHGGGGDRESRP